MSGDEYQRAPRAAGIVSRKIDISNPRALLQKERSLSSYEDIFSNQPAFIFFDPPDIF